MTMKGNNRPCTVVMTAGLTSNQSKGEGRNDQKTKNPAEDGRDDFPGL